MSTTNRGKKGSEIGFDTRFRGYDIKQVDKCFDRLTAKIEQYEADIRRLEECNYELETEKINEYNAYLDNARELAQKKINDAEKYAQSVITQAKQKVMEAEQRLQQIDRQTGDCITDAQQNMMNVIAFTGKLKDNIDQTIEDIVGNSNHYLDALNQISALPANTGDSYISRKITMKASNAE